MFERAKEAFERYITHYDRTNKNIELKYIHTYKVVELMERLAIRLDLDEEKKELAKIIGLLHDIGRFEQIRKFNMISDVKTNTDHAEESCVYLFEEGHIREFVESNKYDSIICKAVKNHNKLAIEPGLTEEELFFSKMIRDMDKVDIFRSSVDHIESKFDQDDITGDVLDDYINGKSVNTTNIKTRSDGTILYLALVNDINFSESIDILAEIGNLNLYLDNVSVTKGSEEMWEKMKGIVLSKINRR